MKIEDVLTMVNEFSSAKKMIKDKLNEIGDKKGVFITSPLICTLISTMDGFKKDIVKLIPEENEHIYRFGYYKNITVMRDYYARTDYITFNEEIHK